MGPLTVLLWKNLIVRKRTLICTILEVVTTVIFFGILFGISFLHIFTPRPASFSLDLENNSVRTPEPYYVDTLMPPQIIVYYPENNLTHQIMNSVGSKLGQMRSYANLNHSGFNTYYGVSNETELMDYVPLLRLDEAVVIFQNMNGPELPDKLRYIIRMKENFLTHTYKALDNDMGSHEGFATIYESFMRLQWTIDKTYLELKKNKTISQRVMLQEFAKNDKPLETQQLKAELIPLCMKLSLMVAFINAATRNIRDRSTGILELIKMVGVSSMTLRISYILDTLPVGVLYSVISTIFLMAGPYPILEYVNCLMLILLFMLHFVYVMVQAFAFSQFLRDAKYAITFSLMVYFIIFVPSDLIYSYLSRFSRIGLLSLVVPYHGIRKFWYTNAIYDGNRQCLPFVAVLEVYAGLVLQICAFFFLGWYLEQVLPGKYGVPLKWNFLCHKSYWCSGKSVQVDASSEEEEEVVQERRDETLFEETPKNLEVGIRVDHVTKIYTSKGRVKVLDKVNLDIYKGEITILLGPNGAGKTTLMSIITGMLKATSGDVYVKGYHSIRQRSQIHKVVGLCPQHNLFFPNLTVKEHVRFFTMLKGESYSQAKSSSQALIEKFNIGEKVNSRCSELSGGMQRRVQLACALAGGAEVLVLDEPTSGLDVETRRELWNLLLSLRGERTVLLTTHFMEEADALGDRVALLNAAQIRCHGTPMFLKKNIGSGYRLTLNTTEAPDEPLITQSVQQMIPEARVKEKAAHSISYNLPANSSGHFPNLFNQLEQNKQQLGIQSMGVGVTTLEEVFLQLCKEEDGLIQTETSEPSEPPPVFEKHQGKDLMKRQIMILFKRQFQYCKSKKYKFLVCEILIPILTLIATCYFSNNRVDLDFSSEPLDMSVGMYRDPKVLVDVDPSRPDIWTAAGNTDVQFVKVDDVAGEAYRLAKDDPTKLKEYVAGVTINATHAVAMYTTGVRHAAPAALALLANLLAGAPLATTLNEPVVHAREHVHKMSTTPKDSDVCMIWALVVCLILTTVYLGNMALTCSERARGSRKALVMAGVPAAYIWMVGLLYNLLLHTLFLILPLLVITYALEFDATFVGGSFYLMMFLITVLGTIAFHWFTSFLTLLMNQRTFEMVTIAIIYIFGIIAGEIATRRMAMEDEISIYEKIASGVGHLIPMYNYVYGMLETVTTARHNSLCESIKANCPNVILPVPHFNSKACCESGSEPMLSYFASHPLTPVFTPLKLLFNIILYMVLLFLVEKGYLSFSSKKEMCADSPYNDPVVVKEKEYVDKNIKLPRQDIKDVMLVHGLYKTFAAACMKKPVNAVRGIDFSVGEGECFGLLGVNGAGKSTTFKMLTADIRPSSGTIYANKYFLNNKDKTKYLQTLSYCPQFHGLDDFLTGREALVLMLTLRGLKDEDIKTECAHWIGVVGLERYANKPISSYSGGCSRRVGTAAALCQRAPLALLDEPTAGVDPASRRRVWRALRPQPGDRASTIITSHSMDEMEHLCGRILILNSGFVCAMGSLPELRAAYAVGHTLHVKLKNNMVNAENAEQLKSYMMQHFDCELRDVHMTKLHYYLNTTLHYSELFTQLQAMVAANSVVEDFALSETTLEEIFLSLAAKPTVASSEDDDLQRGVDNV